MSLTQNRPQKSGNVMLLESKSKFATHQLEHYWDCGALQASYDDGAQQDKQSFLIMM
jgi:hypothetical protein